MLLRVGAGLAIGAVVLALLAPRFNPVSLAINLAAIAVGLLMGKVVGLFLFRRVLPTARR
jgi:ribose/xylose/arabinose/galactoside ABC-type transport system permease subunit